MTLLGEEILTRLDLWCFLLKDFQKIERLKIRRTPLPYHVMVLGGVPLEVSTEKIF